MISGLENIDQGEIFLDQKLINNLLPSKREIAMVFQSYALYPHMNVFENMSFGLKMEKIPKSEINQKVNDAAATLQIEDLLERKPKQLSGGQRQRVAIGRAITRSPKVFLFLSKNNILSFEKDIFLDCSLIFSDDLIIIWFSKILE